MSKNKKVLLGVLGVLLLIGLVIAGLAIKKNLDIKASKRERAERAEAAVNELVLPILEENGVTDAVLRPIESDSVSASCVYESDQFAALSDEEKLKIMIELEAVTYDNKDVFPEGTGLSGRTADVRIACGNDIYWHSTNDGFSKLVKNHECLVAVESGIAEQINESYLQMMEENARSSSGSSSGDCYVCSGTGSVKYYYGESALEAALNGQNDYEYGVCPSCHGTGKAS